MEKSFDQLLKEIDKAHQNVIKSEQRVNRLKQQAAKMQTSANQQERRARVHRFCEIGGGIESDKILGRPITEEDVPLIISFLADQEARGKFLSRWISNQTQQKKSEAKNSPEADHE